MSLKNMSGGKLRSLTAEEKKVAKVVFKTCFKLKHGEKVLVVTDPVKLQKEAAVFFEGAKAFTNQVDLIEFEGMTENAQEPPARVTKMMKQHEVILLVTRYSLSHTRARQEANKQGARIASLPDITLEMMLRTMSIDYDKMAKLSESLATRLSQAKQLSLSSLTGTNLNLNLSGRKGIADTGKLDQPGSFGNLPAGEAFIAPLETQVEGILIIDGALADIKLDKAIKVEIKKGVAVNITGGQAATELKKAMTKAGKNARVVAEFGIGTNSKAILSPNVLESEKVLGTCHIAFGDNVGMGGVNQAPFHSDGIILKPTVIIDGKTLHLAA